MWVLVKDNQVARVVTESTGLQWNDKSFGDLRLIPKADRMEHGIYDFIPGAEPDKYHRLAAEQNAIDHAAGTVTRVNTLAAKANADMDALKRSLKEDIDREGGNVRRAWCSVGWGIELEYRRAYGTAVAWLADQAQPVPRSVQVWADAKGWTAAQAATDIKTKGDYMDGVLIDDIREIRIAGKKAVDDAGYNPATIETAYRGALDALRAKMPPA